MIKGVKGNRLPIYHGVDYTNQKLNGWIVLGMYRCVKNPNGKQYHTIWRVLCCGCKKEMLRHKENIISGKSKGCSTCAGINQSGKRNHRWRGYGDIPATIFSKILWHAEDKGRKVGITIQDLQTLWEQSGGVCSLSGLNIELGIGKTASLDRIDSSKDYVNGNVQWVHKDIQLMKNRLPQNRFIELCRLVFKNHE